MAIPTKRAKRRAQRARRRAHQHAPQAECEKHGIDPERIAELSALGLDPQVAIRGLTEAGREVLK